MSDTPSHKLIRYTVHPEAAEDNAELVRGVYAALAELEPSGFHYATYRSDDGLTFSHLATFDAGAANPLMGLPAFAAFQSDIASRCSTPPEVADLDLVGSYGVFQEATEPA